MSRPETGVLVPVADINDAFIGVKIRTLGCITAYRTRDATATLTAHRASLLVDASLINNANNDKSSIVRMGSNVFVLGTVEKRDGKLVIAAASIFDSDGASLDLWEESARRLSQYLHQGK